MRNYREDVRAGDEWVITDDSGKNVFKVQSVSEEEDYGKCIFWEDGTWTTLDEISDSKYAKPVNEKDMPWTKSEVKEAIRMRLVPMKESGYNIDNEIVLEMLAEYAYSISELAFKKGQE